MQKIRVQLAKGVSNTLILFKIQSKFHILQFSAQYRTLEFNLGKAFVML